LIIDHISANGNTEAPIWQRTFWIVTAGATANSLLTVGGPTGMKVLRSISIIVAFPFCLLIAMVMLIFIRFLPKENDEGYQKRKNSSKDWNMNIFDAGARVIMGIFTLGFSGDNYLYTISALLATPLLQIRSRASIGDSSVMRSVVFTLSFLLLPI